MAIPRREALLQELELERELARRRELRPLDHMSWLPLQVAYFMDMSKRKDARAGNQGHGKTTAGCADVHWRASGRHPFRLVPPPPVHQWVLSPTERASGIAQRKMWELTDLSELAPESPVFDPRKGAFSGKYPKMMFKNGSTVEFRWGGGDLMNLASGTVHHVWIDEPPESERVYNELQKRLLRTNGDLSMTLTPVNRPVEWLRDRVAAGRIRDIHYSMRPEHLVFAAGPRAGQRICLEDGTPCDQEWIDGLIAETSDIEVPVTVHGEWEFRLGGAYFDRAWDESKLVYDAAIEDTDHLVLGIDHGDRPGKQVAVLMAVDDRGELPSVHVVDHYRDEVGLASPLEDARGILDMLTRHRIPWSRLKFAGGDRVHLPGSARQKSNRDLAAQLRKLLGVRQLSPEIRTVKRGEGRGQGSLRVGMRWLFHAMVAGRFSVAPRCEHLIQAGPKVQLLDDDDGYKDLFDAIRYGLDSWIFAYAGSGQAPKLRLYSGGR